MTQLTLEVCIDSVQGALAAEAGGADRLELCGNLIQGGTTPSTGLIRSVLAATRLPVMVMIRPRGGSFCYNTDELETMFAEADSVLSESIPGIVIGSLTTDGDVDLPTCTRLCEMAGPRSVTFHRAFDHARDAETALQHLIELGIDRVLTSGQAPTAPQGIPLLRALIDQAANEIVVMPGCGIRAQNVRSVLAGTRATEIHCSASTSQQLAACFWRTDVPMGSPNTPEGDERIRRVTCQKTVREIRSHMNDWANQ
ncbi:copper homeostasis protein CutC [Stieleria marina]|uniref:copper homeostasis protein CutC n=1 Tax=Stieleria marina TaxID=1930275 RepID=UPI003AF355AB